MKVEMIALQRSIYAKALCSSSDDNELGCFYSYT